MKTEVIAKLELSEPLKLAFRDVGQYAKFMEMLYEASVDQDNATYHVRLEVDADDVF